MASAHKVKGHAGKLIFLKHIVTTRQFKVLHIKALKHNVKVNKI